MSKRQNEITERGPLLKEDGSLAQKGWAKELLLHYDQTKIKAGSWRIKEWDYYCILGKDFGIAITLADISYLGLYAINFFDFTRNTETSDVVIEPFTFGKLNFPSDSSNGDIVLQHKKIRVSFKHQKGKRLLAFDFPGFDKGKGISGLIELETKNKDSMVIATPFAEAPKAFYYNQKINCLAASGDFQYADKTYRFDPATDLGVLDWGRGVWTYKNQWYWGSASGWLNGEPFGFNIGYGFGDISAASENMLFYKGIAHKLEQVEFHIDTKNYLASWKFTSNDGRFELDFRPAIDRFSDTNLLVLRSRQHQVFGYFSGKVKLDDGTVLEISNLLGFAEDVYNRW